MNIVEIEQRKRAIQVEIAAEKARHDSAIRAMRTEYALVEERAQMIGAGIDEAAVLRAARVIYVHGSYAKGGEDRHSVIEDAITDLLAGGAKLMREFFGTKCYAHWYGQRSDHTYGYGPKHGSIIFAIGLREPIRACSGVDALTPEEIESAIYFLRNIERIQAAQASAIAAGADA